MQLTIDSEDIVGIKMSALEESQENKVSELINDLKKDIQSNLKDDLKVNKDEEVSDKAGVVDIVDVNPETELNGCGEDETISNGLPETHNSDKENDAPKDSETVFKVENSVENTANSPNSILKIAENQVTADNIDNEKKDAPKDSETVFKVENSVENTANSPNSILKIAENQVTADNIDNESDNASSTQDNTATDVVNSVIDIIPANNTEPEDSGKRSLDDETTASEKSSSAKTLRKETLEPIEEVDAKLVSHSTNSMEKSTIEHNDQNPLTNSENDESSIVTTEIIECQQIAVDSKQNTEKAKVDSSQMEVDVHDAFKNSFKNEDEKNVITETEDMASHMVIDVNDAIKKSSKDELDKNVIVKTEVDSSQMEVGVNDPIENSSKDEVDKCVIVKSEIQLVLPAENCEKQYGTTNHILNESNVNNDVSIGEPNKLILKSEEKEKSETDIYEISEISKEIPTDNDKEHNRNTDQSEDIADPVDNIVKCNTSKDKISSLSDSDKLITCKKEIKSVTEDAEVLIEENKTESKSQEQMNIASEKEKECIVSDATPTIIETSSDKQTVDVSQIDINSKPVDKTDSDLLDEKCNEKSVKTKIQQSKSEALNESEAINDTNENINFVQNSGVEKLKDNDCVSVSSMEVDDVEIVPTEKVKTEISKSLNDSMDVSVTNDEDNVIEIFDQDVVESADNVESEKKPEKNTSCTKNDQAIIKTEEKIEDKLDISDEEDIKIIENTESKPQTANKEEPSVESKALPVVCKLSNTLDILSDEEDEPPSKVSKVEEKKPEPKDKQCIDIDDDDDIMLIEDMRETPAEAVKPDKEEQKISDKVNVETGEKEASKLIEDPTPNINEKEPTITDIKSPKVSEKEASPPIESVKETNKPLLPINFLKSAKKNLAEMTRDELEEFCILKIVESIVDRSSLSDIKSKIKNIEKNMEEYKKKAMLLSKQNRDLQVVLKSVQEEQKNKPNTAITPLKITRSVGMQVLMLDKGPKKKTAPQNANANTPKPTRNMVQPARPQRTPSNNQNIPVPRLIPASPAKGTPCSPITTIAKPVTPNGIRNTVSPAQKSAEKRPMTRQVTASGNMTVDLTDDEPPAKVNKSSPVPPVRLVPSQNLMAPLRGQMQTNNPRKVFIPINGQGHNIVRGQTAVMLKSVPQAMGPRQRLPSMPRMTANPVRFNLNRHPAPLPDVMKQYQPPTWKALPPAPDLKLSKVENGIVISWKIEGYQEDSYEKIASYQLYAYQETSTPPSTALWKKIGDVKALPLPMACTLTQFMAGFKYYFAVRAVDVKSRLGPFSLPGSILLLNKM